MIYERGCLRAGEEWIEGNLVPVAGVAVGVAILQVEGEAVVCDTLCNTCIIQAATRYPAFLACLPM